MNNKTKLLPLIVILSLLLLGGCVKRNLHVMTNPPGARFYFDRDLIGQTPLDFDFMYYAVHKVEVEKEGYERLTTLVNLKPPLQFWLPLDFFCEIIPRDFWDKKELSYTLVPLKEE